MTNNNKYIGLWEQGTIPPVQDFQEIKNLLMQILKPLYVLDINGKTGIGYNGNAFLGKNTKQKIKSHKIKAYIPAMGLENLGDSVFKKRHSIKYPYIAGAMANGISSVKMVKKMAENGMLGFFGSGGLLINEVEHAIIQLKKELNISLPFGFNLIHSQGDYDLEMAVVNLYLKHKIRLISAAAFMRITLPLVLYRLKGIYRDSNDKIITPNKIIGKVSRIEVAKQFFSPAPEKIVKILFQKKLITETEAELSRFIPMAQDITAEADSGGHTDNRPSLTVFPIMQALKHEFNEKYKYQEHLCVGFAGGIATPESSGACFQMGGDYILTGSINQSCIEAGTSEHVRQILAQAKQADVAMAPSANMFEMGAKVQVLKRGTMFPLKAQKLYRLYKTYNSFNEIDEKIKKEIEKKIFQTSVQEKWEQTKDFFKTRNIREIEKAENDPKHKMALLFRSYLGLSSKWALQGNEKKKMDYQIWCGPSMGAFNYWVKKSFLESHKNRKVAEIGLNLLFGACFYNRVYWLKAQNIDIPLDLLKFKPIKKNDIFKLIV
ncbi:MAG: 2-nitropropane dioxygenase [Desulfobacteraceae bacterium 4572_130]|nr:MAG: 2-nitropropane dioxygenase [Desulfobacteraceae bacterium 4572_130]